jgi:hypothetical protein
MFGTPLQGDKAATPELRRARPDDEGDTEF